MFSDAGCNLLEIKNKPTLHQTFLLFSNVQWNVGSFDHLIQHCSIGVRAAVGIFSPNLIACYSFSWKTSRRPVCDCRLFTIFTSYNKIWQFQLKYCIFHCHAHRLTCSRSRFSSKAVLSKEEGTKNRSLQNSWGEFQLQPLKTVMCHQQIA